MDDSAMTTTADQTAEQEEQQLQQQEEEEEVVVTSAPLETGEIPTSSSSSSLETNDDMVIVGLEETQQQMVAEESAPVVVEEPPSVHAPEPFPVIEEEKVPVVIETAHVVAPTPVSPTTAATTSTTSTTSTTTPAATTSSSFSFFGRLTSKISESVDSISTAAKTSANNYKASISTAVATAAIKAKNITKDNSPLKRVIVEIRQARNLVAMGENGRSDPFVMLELGDQVRKTHSVFKSLDPIFRESFELSTRSKKAMMRCTVFNTDFLGLHDSMGYFDIDLGVLPIGEEYYKWCQITNTPVPNKKGVKKNKKREKAALDAGKDISVGEGPGEVLVSIAVSELYDHELSGEDKVEAKANSCGWLRVHVMESVGLPSHKALSCDPFCTVRVGNKTFRTDSVKGTRSPKWDSFFELPVKDIFDVVELDVLNEDPTGESDFLGGIMVPLLEIKNNSMQWFALKKANHLAYLEGETAGIDPAIRVAFYLTYDIPKGALSLFQKRDARHVDNDEPFSFAIMRTNAERLKAIAMQGIDASKNIDKAMNFEYGLGFNVGVLVGWTVFWIIFELYMVPLACAIGIVARGVDKIKAGRKESASVASPTSKAGAADAPDKIELEKKAEEEEEEEEEGTNGNESMMKNITKYLKMRNLLQFGQNLLQDVFDHAERIDNLTNWKFPIFSMLLVIILFSSTVVLFFLPMRLVPILLGFAVFARISLLHYLPELKKGHKDGLRARVHDLVHAIPPVNALVMQTFLKFPSNTDLQRRENKIRTDLSVSDMPTSTKILASLDEDARVYNESLKAAKKTN